MGCIFIVGITFCTSATLYCLSLGTEKQKVQRDMRDYEEAKTILTVPVRCPLSLVGQPDNVWRARSLYEAHVEDLRVLTNHLLVRIYTCVLVDTTAAHEAWVRIQAMRCTTHPTPAQVTELEAELAQLAMSGTQRGNFKLLRGAHSIEAVHRSIAAHPNNPDFKSWQPLVKLVLVQPSAVTWSNLFNIGTFDNAQQRLGKASVFADLVIRLRRQMQLAEEVNAGMDFSTEKKRMKDYRKRMLAAKGAMQHSMLLGDGNFNLHWLCATVSDEAWVYLNRVLLGDWDEGCNEDGKVQAPNSHTSLTKIKNVPDEVLITLFKQVLNCTIKLKELNRRCQVFKVKRKIFTLNWIMIAGFFSDEQVEAIDAADGPVWERIHDVIGQITGLDLLMDELSRTHMKDRLTVNVPAQDIIRISQCLTTFFEKEETAAKRRVQKEATAAKVRIDM